MKRKETCKITTINIFKNSKKILHSWGMIFKMVMERKNTTAGTGDKAEETSQ